MDAGNGALLLSGKAAHSTACTASCVPSKPLITAWTTPQRLRVDAVGQEKQWGHRGNLLYVSCGHVHAVLEHMRQCLVNPNAYTGMTKHAW